MDFEKLKTFLRLTGEKFNELFKIPLDDSIQDTEYIS